MPSCLSPTLSCNAAHDVTTRVINLHRLQELAALDKVAGATLVASNVLAAGLKAGQQQEWKLTFECKLHPYFPVLVLKKQ